ncbi:MAG: response regulator transcription factor [Sporichthyaceae bacterium]
MSGRVLVVEDDHGLRDVVARALREAGFEVTTAADGSGALRTAKAARFDVVVLDIGLPDADGRDVCQAMRAGGTTAPVVFLTAKDGVTDRLSGFAAGGDDYLAKPFHLAELVARLQVAVRRSGEPTGTTTGDVHLDPSGHDLTGPGGRVPLSPTEFRLLARLMVEPRGVVRRNELVAAAWAHGSIVADNTLDQYVAKIRRKLVEAGTSQTVVTVRGVGYRVS